MEKQPSRSDCKYQGTALDLIVQATDTRDYGWFDGYFEKRLAHSTEFLRELLQNLGTVPEEEVFMIKRMLKRLFCQASGARIDGGFEEDLTHDPVFLRGIILNVGIIPRKEVKSAQQAIAQIFC